MSILKQSFLAIVLAVIVLFFGQSCFADATSDDIATLKTKIKEHAEAEKYGDAVIAALELKNLARSKGDLAAEFDALNSLGLAYSWLGAFEEALDAYESALSRFDPTLNPKLHTALYIGMSKLLMDMGRNEDALKVVETGVNTIRQKSGTETELADLRGRKAAVLLQIGKLDEAQEILEEVSKYWQSVGNDYHYGKTQNNIGMAHKLRGENKLALLEFEEVLKIGKRSKNTVLEVYALLEFGDINRILGRYEDARKYLNDALSLSEKAGETFWRQYAHSYMAALDKETGDLNSAMENTKQVNILKQQRFKQEGSNREALLQTILAVANRENQLALLEKDHEIQAIELKRSRTLALVTGVGLFLLFVAMWFIYKHYKMQAQTSLKLAVANKKLGELASTDSLTGLANRRSLLDQVSSDEKDRRASGQDSTLILLDLDHFKRINDQFGHDHGDAVLVEVSRRLESKLRDSDMVARWGGEEFLVLLPHTQTDKALKIANILRKAVAETPIEFDGVQHQIAATLGVSLYNDDCTFNQSLQRADEALYRGKKTGRNRVEIAGS
jgi:diguanylate cyclase (GGDEF)-like protein